MCHIMTAQSTTDHIYNSDPIGQNRVKPPTSGQDGGMAKHGSLPCTTTPKLQQNYRIAIIQNPQKLS